MGLKPKGRRFLRVRRHRPRQPQTGQRRLWCHARYPDGVIAAGGRHAGNRRSVAHASGRLRIGIVGVEVP